MKLSQKTPLQQYKALKESFCSDFSDQNAWGIHQDSGKRLDAYQQLIFVLKRSEELVELDEALKDEISYENVKLLLGNEIRLPKSLKISMMRTFTLDPFENMTKKFHALMGKLDSEAESLRKLLRDLSKSCDVDDPFPYMRGLPSYAERCGYLDFGGLDRHSDEEDDFQDYLFENCLYVCDDRAEESSEHESGEECPENDSVKVSFPSRFERVSAKLRKLRWKIYQKIESKSISNTDLDKYEALVGKFVHEFGNKELSKWEIGLWQRKVIRTRNDALDSPFDEHLFNDDLSDISLSSLDKNDSVNCEEILAKVDSVEEFFENQKALENLLSNLPSVPNSEDEELEERLRRLRSYDEPDETREVGNNNEESLDDGVSVRKIMNPPLQVESEKNVKESTAKIPKVKGDNSDKIEVLDDRTENKTIPLSPEVDAFDAKQQLNDWFENELRKKKKTPKPVEVPVKADAFHSEDIFMNKMAENKEYKQQKFSESSEFQNQDVNSPDLLIFMRACFILLITMCKTLNDQSLKIANISNPNFPLISYTLPTSKPLPCFVTMYERTSSCHCVQSVSVLTTVTAIMSSAGIMVTAWYRWTRLQLQKWKEKVMLDIAIFWLNCLSEDAAKSIFELNVGIVKK